MLSLAEVWGVLNDFAHSSFRSVSFNSRSSNRLSISWIHRYLPSYLILFFSCFFFFFFAIISLWFFPSNICFRSLSSSFIALLIRLIRPKKSAFPCNSKFSIVALKSFLQELHKTTYSCSISSSSFSFPLVFTLG